MGTNAKENMLKNLQGRYAREGKYSKEKHLSVGMNFDWHFFYKGSLYWFSTMCSDDVNITNFTLGGLVASYDFMIIG